MSKLSNANKIDILTEFQNFLLEKKLAQKKNIFFYALRASKYFTYSIISAWSQAFFQN